MLDAFPGRRVVFRTLDVGADKPLPFVTRAPEPNPALGVRGVRLSLRRPKLFEHQLRALLRAHRDHRHGARMAVMFPMVSRVDELQAARSELARVAGDEGIELHDLEVGVMIEVPSAALAAPRIAPLVDFLSIGTNDLLQYLFASDPLVAGALVGLGVRELSMAPAALAEVKHLLARHSLAALAGAAADARTAPSAGDARARLATALC